MFLPCRPTTTSVFAIVMASILLNTSLFPTTVNSAAAASDVVGNVVRNDHRFVQQVQGNTCETPIPITLDDGVNPYKINGTTTNDNNNAEITGFVPSCYAEERIVKFYSFPASGAKYTITTCSSHTNYLTSLIVESGDNSCNIGCSSTQDDTSQDCPTVTFFSEPNEMYTIAVLGRTPGSVGNYELSITEYMLPTNDQCDGSIMITPTTSLEVPSIIGASTMNATPKLLSCESESYIGIYYKFIGTGARFHVNTCPTSNNSTNYSFDANFLVDDDVECQDIGCTGLIDMTETSCSDNLKGKVMEFRSVEDMEYTILVRGTESSTSTGEFDLTVMEYIRPSNDQCQQPILIDDNFNKDNQASVIGSTENATLVPFACVAELYPTIFYKVIGTGETFHATTCSNITNFKTSIIVNGGGACTDENPTPNDCDPDMQSILMDNSECDAVADGGQAAMISWKTIVDEEYLIAIKGEVPQEKGTFILTIQQGGDTITDITTIPTDTTTTAKSGTSRSYYDSMITWGWMMMTITLITSASILMI